MAKKYKYVNKLVITNKGDFLLLILFSTIAGPGCLLAGLLSLGDPTVQTLLTISLLIMGICNTLHVVFRIQQGKIGYKMKKVKIELTEAEKLLGN